MQTKKQTLIIINGAPGVGKTTLLRKFVKDLEMPGIGKDAPLEFGDIAEVVDTTNFGDADYTELLGRVRKLL